MGLAAYGRPSMCEQVRKLIRRTPDGAFALVPEYFEYQTTAGRSYSSRFVDLFGPPRTPFEPIDVETAEGRRFADCAASVQRVLEDTLVDIARALHERDRPAGSLLRRRCGAQWRGERAHPRGVRLRASCSCRPRPVTPAVRSAPRSTPIASTSRTPIATCPIIRSGDRRSMPRSSRGPRGKTIRRRRARRRTRSSSGSRTISPPAASSAGWTAPASSARARSVIAASSPRRSRARCAIGSTATSSIARTSGRSRRWSPLEAADRYFELPPGGARLGRFMSGVFPVRPEWRAELAAVTHVDGSARVQVLERRHGAAAARAARGVRTRTGMPVLLNTSFNVAGEPIVNAALEGYSTFRRCGIDALVAGCGRRDQARHGVRRRRRRSVA